MHLFLFVPCTDRPALFPLFSIFIVVSPVPFSVPGTTGVLLGGDGAKKEEKKKKGPAIFTIFTNATTPVQDGATALPMQSVERGMANHLALLPTQPLAVFAFDASDCMCKYRVAPGRYLQVDASITDIRPPNSRPASADPTLSFFLFSFFFFLFSFFFFLFSFFFFLFSFFFFLFLFFFLLFLFSLFSLHLSIFVTLSLPSSRHSPPCPRALVASSAVCCTSRSISLKSGESDNFTPSDKKFSPKT